MRKQFDKRVVKIFDDTENHRYVIELDGKRAGEAVYHVRSGKHLFVHTEISPDFGGQGLGSELVRFALDDVRDKGGSIVPICPFFVSFIGRHEEYAELVDRDLTERVNGLRNSG